MPNAKTGPGAADKQRMKKQVVNWKPVRGRNKLGEMYFDHYFPQLIDSSYRSELLHEIISMSPKKPISFEGAINLARKEFSRAAESGQIGYDPGQSFWYFANFIQWIADQGYSIELTGDEFETTSICRLVA